MYHPSAVEGKTVAELRDMARKNRSTLGVSGLEIAGASKDQLLTWLVADREAKEFREMVEEVPEPKPVKMNRTNGNGHSDDLAAVIARAIQDKIHPQAELDENRVREIVAEVTEATPNALTMKAVKAVKDWAQEELQRIAEIASSNISQIELFNPVTQEVKKIGLQHKLFENLLKIVSCRLDCMLVGPAASGKTFAAEAVSKALDLPFYMQPVGSQTTKFDLLGYMDATGKYVTTHLREAYEKGGVFLLDEVDAGNANVLTVINGMTSNAIASFPDAMIKRHPDFILICAANTYGRGADRMYVGRNQLDAATLDRFVVIDWDYDEDLEKAISGNAAWTEKVLKVRKAVFDLKEKLVVSPRASMKGAQLLAAGFSEDVALDMVVFKGINAEVKSRVLAKIEVN